MNTNTTDHGPTVEGYEVVELVPAQDVAALVAERDRLREVNAALVAQLTLAVRYLDHPDVRAIPFSLPAAAVAERARAALAQSKGE